MNPSKSYDPLTHCVAGGLAGGAAAAVTTPLDVIKTLLQTRGTVQDAEIRNANGLMQAARIIKARNGWGGFFRGLRPRILQTMPSTAICWYVRVWKHIGYIPVPANGIIGQRMRWQKLTSSENQRRPREASAHTPLWRKYLVVVMEFVVNDGHLSGAQVKVKYRVCRHYANNKRIRRFSCKDRNHDGGGHSGHLKGVSGT